MLQPGGGICPRWGMALADRTPTPEDLAWRRELDCAFSLAAGKLPKRLQDVYTLCCTSGLSVREAAHTLGLTVPATKARLFRAQHRMQSELGKRLVVEPQRKTSGAGPPTIARSRMRLSPTRPRQKSSATYRNPLLPRTTLIGPSAGSPRRARIRPCTVATTSWRHHHAGVLRCRNSASASASAVRVPSRPRCATVLALSNRSTCTISRGGTPSARVGRGRALLRRQNRKEKSQTGINSSGCEKDGEFCGFFILRTCRFCGARLLPGAQETFVVLLGSPYVSLLLCAGCEVTVGLDCRRSL